MEASCQKLTPPVVVGEQQQKDNRLCRPSNQSDLKRLFCPYNIYHLLDKKQLVLHIIFPKKRVGVQKERANSLKTARDLIELLLKNSVLGRCFVGMLSPLF